jgi:2'-5' RNA ligase
MRLAFASAGRHAVYNCLLMSETLRYALVAYVRNPVGEFVEKLRRELHPELPHLAAHLTILPPRTLQSTEPTAREVLEEVCSGIEPFEVTLGDVETFVPVTPTVFIRVAYAAYRLRELHDRLNTTIFGCSEQWPYMPHLTIVKMSTEQQAKEAYRIAHERWASFHGKRSIRVSELTFVREQEPNCWRDLAGVPLGRALVRGQ